MISAAKLENGIGDRQVWACAVLGLDLAQASPEAARRQFLRIVADSDFVPEIAVEQAYQCMIGRLPGSRGVDAWKESREASLQVEIQAYAATFFQLPIAERRSTYARLMNKAGDFPRCLWRLKALETGLPCDLDCVRPEDTTLAELGRMMGALFVLPPPARAAFRCDLMEQFCHDGSRWEAAARRLRRKYRRIAALDIAFVSQIASHSRIVRHRARNRRRQERAIRMQRTKKSLSWLWWLFFVAVLIVFKITEMGNRQRRQSSPESKQMSPVLAPKNR